MAMESVSRAFVLFLSLRRTAIEVSECKPPLPSDLNMIWAEGGLLTEDTRAHKRQGKDKRRHVFEHRRGHFLRLWFGPNLR